MIMAEVQTNIGAFYVIMFLSLIGIIATVLYLIISILLYRRKKNKLRTEKNIN